MFLSKQTSVLKAFWPNGIAWLALSILFTTPISMGSANGTKDQAQGPTATIAAAAVSRVKLLLNVKGSPAMEITSTRPIRPVVTRIQDPPGLRIDLNDTQMSVPHKQITVKGPLIDAVDLYQLTQTPPVVRILVNQRKPLSCTWDAAGNRLTIRFHAETEEASAKPPSVPALLPGTAPAAVAVSSNLTFADQTVSGSSFSAKFATETLRLSRGGEVHLCPGTTVSMVRQKKGPDLMLAMGVGALETHYALEDSADTIITPDFRIMLRGPGEFHYAIRADSQGNTCVRALPGNTAPVVVYESIGNGQFEVVPTEKLVFHAGHLSAVDTAFHSGQSNQVETILPNDCGCPAPPPLLRADLLARPAHAENNASATPQLEDAELQRTATPQTPNDSHEIAVLPPLPPDQKPVKFSASLVFSAKDARPPRIQDLPLSQRQIPSFPQIVQPPTQAPATRKKSQKGILRKLTGLVSRIFH